MNARIKGTALQPSIDYIRSVYGTATWDRVLDRLSEEQRHELSRVQGTTPYPLTLPGAMFTALVAAEYGGDVRRADAELRKMGRHAAQEQLSGIYSLFVRFSSPEKSLGRISQVIVALYPGGETELIHKAGETHGTVHIRGLGEFAYAAPRLCGWAEYALERSGAKSARAVERAWQAGQIASSDLIFDVTWR